MALTKVTSAGLTDDSIVNADINSSAAVALSKLATDPSNATNLASGTVPTARLGSGTASSSTVLYGDQTYKAEPTGGVNTPAFHAYVGTNPAPADGATVKAPVDTEVYDTGGCFDAASNYRFTPTTAGKYYVYAQMDLEGGGGANVENAVIYIYRNGSQYALQQWEIGTARANLRMPFIATQMDMDGSSDYTECYVYINYDTGPGVINAASQHSYFGAFLIIGA